MANQQYYEQDICKQCVMPAIEPYVHLGSSGICSICLSENETAKFSPKLVETDLLKLLQKQKKQGDYDCLVMCSGGKDSTASLYYMKKRYGLNVLAFTFDHGFENPEAANNINRAVENLGVDYLFYKSTYMKDLFAEILLSGSKAVICHLCSIWYMGLTFDIAEKYKIPTIVAGWTKGQYSMQDSRSRSSKPKLSPEFFEMAKETELFLGYLGKKFPKYKSFPRSMEEVIKRANKKWKSIVISPHWFLPFDENHYVELIKNELNWQEPKLSYPKKSTNCLLNYMSTYLAMKNYGFTHYHVEMSKLIRAGQMTREEAIGRLNLDFDPKLLDQISQKIVGKVLE